MKDAESYQERLLRYLDGTLPPEEEARVADLLRQKPEARAFLRDVAEQAVTVADVERVEKRRRGEVAARRDWGGDRREAIGFFGGSRTRSARWSWAVAAAAVIALIASVTFQGPSAERQIAKITGLSGPLQWTGDGGRVSHDLSVGTGLPGGTLEGMAPGSWVEFAFNDGSTVAFFGNSTLTFSDDGQKKLHLKGGKLSGNVKPQAPGKPMLIHTRSALLEVLGTQFEVEAGLAATMLNVSEGEIRVKRLSDGRTVKVTANHRVTAAADREMLPVPAPKATRRWESQLRLGPDGTQGKWSPATDAEASKLRAIPYTTPRGTTIYTAALGVSRGDRPLVLLQPASHLRVRGQIASAHPVYFGVTVRRPEGEFAGRFQTVRPADEFQGGQPFEVMLPLQAFQLDPSLYKMRDQLPQAPFDLVVESFWCHTLDKQAGLEVTELELIPSGSRVQ